MKKIVVVLAAALTLLAVWTLLPAGATGAAVLVDSTLATAYTIPTAGASPQNIVVESPGKVWFTLPGAHALGSLVVTDTTNYKFSIYQTTPGGAPYDLVYDNSTGTIWFTEKGANAIGRFNIAAKTVTTYTLPTANSAPTGIDIAPDGRIWYVGQNGNQFGSFTPGPSAFSETVYPTSGAQFVDIAVSSNDEIWASSPPLNRLVKFRPSVFQFVTAPVNDILQPSWSPGGIDMGVVGQPWAAAPTKNLVGFLSPGTLTNWFWYTLPGGTSGDPTALVYTDLGSNKVVWYVKTNANKAGQLVIKSDYSKVSSREIGLPTGAAPAGIAADAGGHVWMTAPGTNQIIEWRPPYFYLTHLPVIRRIQE